jgi:hypothetical protein
MRIRFSTLIVFQVSMDAKLTEMKATNANETHISIAVKCSGDRGTVRVPRHRCPGRPLPG